MAEAAGDIFGPINAETGDTSQFNSTTVEGTGTFDAHADALAHGSYGFRAIADGTNNEFRGNKTLSDLTEIYFRVYFNIDPNMLLPASGGAFVCALMDGSTTLLRFGPRNSTGGAAAPNQWYCSGQGWSGTLTTTNFTLDAWHYLDVHWLAGTGADGGATAWIDANATPLINDVDNNLTAYAADGLRVGITDASVLAEGDYVYIDDILGKTTGPIGVYTEAGAGAAIPILAHYYRMMRD